MNTQKQTHWHLTPKIMQTALKVSEYSNKLQSYEIIWWSNIWFGHMCSVYMYINVLYMYCICIHIFGYIFRYWYTVSFKCLSFLCYMMFEAKILYIYLKVSSICLKFLMSPPPLFYSEENFNIYNRKLCFHYKI